MRFSEYFELDRTQPYLDFVDIPIDTDLAVFLEPIAIKKLDSNWGNELSSMLQTFFEAVLKAIKKSDHKRAKSLLSSLNESNEFHLGYSKGKSRGHGFGVESADTVWSALTSSNAAITGLLKDLEDTALLIPNIGSDMISDAVCNILRGPLIKYTQDMCNYYGVNMTPDIPSGPIWNPILEVWEERLISLPITPHGKVILVPKLLVRMKLSYSSSDFYRHYLLPEMQREHIESHSPLVRLLKNGNHRVHKKDLIKKYGKDKLAVAEQARLRPNILEEYREQKAEEPLKPMSFDDFAFVEKSKKPDVTPLLEELKETKKGTKYATKYEDIIERILTLVFYPSLCNPKKQHNIHQKRKRIDITYNNEAKSGFFYWLALHHPSSQIFVECKNYSNEISNPEIDQLSGRFSPSRGKVGFLVYRDIEDKEKLIQRCIDTANDHRGFIIPLDDNDIINLAKNVNSDEQVDYNHYLEKLFNRLISSN
ncbi:MAG TPA: hypothetical protein ENH88_05235 [Pseudoalteromonas prydzensis]|uniref:Restriction endonuclease type IV Mrr domain-containing protein n=1 Tax=Pseudoalteromonas prydzensis TaxID=182141 RepID=A0A7V1GDN2_9GAMM|nr:hypothetical protein [Pseudoalteromonas prydzensis]HEA15848.1 hypothetical protein [Pseudoalteromonas prydzensis]